MTDETEQHGPYRVWPGDATEGVDLEGHDALAAYVKAHPGEYLFIRDLTTGEWHTENDAAKPDAAKQHND